MIMKRKMHLMCLMTKRKLQKSLLENIYRSSNLTRLDGDSDENDNEEEDASDVSDASSS